MAASSKKKIKEGTTTSNTQGITTNSKTTTTTTNNDDCLLTMVPLDALCNLMTFLPAKSLAAMVMTCRYFHSSPVEETCFQAHLCSRLNNSAVQLLQNEEQDVKELWASIFPSNTATATDYTNNNKNNKKNKHTRIPQTYPTYAQFLEESVTGCTFVRCIQQQEEWPLLPPFAKVNGKIASVSPEHTLCRMGGGGGTRTSGGSGCASWGVGKRGQLGHGSRNCEASPTQILRAGIGYYNTTRVVQVSAGGGLVRVAHSLLLTQDGRVFSFGTGHYGQLGHGFQSGKQLPDETRPRIIDALAKKRIVCISAGELHSAAICEDGSLYTWGDSFCGQCGHGDKRPQLLPKKVAHTNIKHETCMTVSCGNRHTIVVTEEGDVFTFGLGHYGVLGRLYTPFDYDNTNTAATTATSSIAPPPPDASGMDGGGFFQMTQEQMEHLDLLANCTLDDSSDQCIPVVVDSLSGIHIVGASAGHRHSLVLDRSGLLYSFGTYLGGALGHGNLEKQDYPMCIQFFVENQIRIAQFSAGVDISMAVSTEGDVYGWGKSKGGRIGVGNKDVDVLLPRHVPLDTKAVDVECGYVHSVIVSVDGSILICGGVGINGSDDGQQQQQQQQQPIEESDIAEGEVMNNNEGFPVKVPDFIVWHCLPEPKSKATTGERWKKYGKYELQGRSKALAETARWNG